MAKKPNAGNLRAQILIETAAIALRAARNPAHNYSALCRNFLQLLKTNPLCSPGTLFQRPFILI
jgi:hypothetical protein